VQSPAGKKRNIEPSNRSEALGAVGPVQGQGGRGHIAAGLPEGLSCPSGADVFGGRSLGNNLSQVLLKVTPAGEIIRTGAVVLEVGDANCLN